MWLRRAVGCVVAYGFDVSANMIGLPGLYVHGGDGVRAGLA
jgi:hypothetical protein